MSTPPLTRKEQLWLDCATKSCCSNTVFPTGRDVWRLSRLLDAPPWAFLVQLPAACATADAFLLAPGGPRFRLALAHQPRRDTRALPRCTFLLRTRDGARRCGLGLQRPIVCRAFPAELRDGLLMLREQAGCTCRAWSLAEVEIAEEAELVRLRDDETKEYRRVVERWNARVEAAPPDASFNSRLYLRFLLDTYDALESAAVAEALP